MQNKAMEQSALPAADSPVEILIVDDHPNTAATLARTIAQLGTKVHVRSAINGHEALEQVKNSTVDILITDMMMPEMTGLELIEKFQKHLTGRPALYYLMTAYNVPGLDAIARSLKITSIIIKPVHPEKISQILTKAIESMKNEIHS